MPSRTLPRMRSCPAVTGGPGAMMVSPPQVGEPTVTSRSRSRKSSHVRVVARIRPLSAAEKKRSSTECVVPLEPEDKENASSVPFAHSPDGISSPGPATSRGILCSTPKMGNVGSQGATEDGTSKASTPSDTTTSKLIAKGLTAGEKQFDFDAVFEASTSQKDVYDHSVGDAVKRNIFKGYNTTILAYGQTGSGKTYTMDGPSDEIIDEDAEMISPGARPFRSPTFCSPKKGRKSMNGSLKPPMKRSSFGDDGDGNFVLMEDDGIIPRAVKDLFEAKQQHQSQGIKIHLTYMEIYNDEIRDLLADDDSTENLQLRDNGDSGVHIKGLSSLEVESALDAKKLMDIASVRRTTGSTRTNARSSRSHAICVLNVSISQGKRRRKAKLTLVDLAGSERLKQTGAEGLQQKEGININRDLFVLAKVVSALADRAKQGRRASISHVPYRDCKLTRILRDSLGGNCCTVMVACISPADINLEESTNTLRYAERAKAIQNQVKQNVVKSTMTSAESTAMRRENKMLKNQISELMKSLKEVQSAISEGKEPKNIATAPTPTCDTEAQMATSPKEEESKAAGGVGALRSMMESSLKKTEGSNKDAKGPLLLQSEIFLDTFQFGVGNADDEDLLSVDDTISSCGQTIESSILGMNETIDSDIAGKRELLERLDGDAAKLQETVDSLRMEQGAMEKTLLETRSQKHRLEDEVGEMKDSQKRILKEMTAMKNQVQVLVCERKQLLDEVEEAQELSAMISLLNEEQDARKEAEDELQKLKNESASSSEEQSTLREMLAKSKENASKLQVELEAVNATLQQQLEDRENEDNSVARMLIQSEDLKLKAELKALTYENATLRQRIKDKENEDSVSEMLSKSEVLKLKAEIKTLVSENVALKENKEPVGDVAPSNKAQIFGERSANIDAVPSAEAPVRDDRNSQSFVKESPAFDSDSESVKSEQRAIRIHAAKMLFYANKSIERTGDYPSDSSEISSITSMQSSCGSIDVSLSSKKPKKNKKSGFGNLRKRLSRKNKLPPKPVPRSATVVNATTPSDIELPKDTINGVSTNRIDTKTNASRPSSTAKDVNSCMCSSPLFTKNAGDMDFYLPKLSTTCTCGKAEQSVFSVGEPLDLANILRPWQVSFLATVGVTSTEELIWAQANDARRICSAMKSWREVNRMKPVTPKSCAIALHIWTKTAKVIQKSTLQQMATGHEAVEKPKFLDISLTSKADSVSTIGDGSLHDSRA